MKRTNTATWYESQRRWQIKVQKNGIRKTFYSGVTGRAGQRECNAKADAWLDDGVENPNAKLSRLTAEYLENLKQTVDVLMNFVSTHDIERAINRFGGQNCDDKSKDWMAENWLSDAEYKRGKQLLKAAMVLQFFLPGVPSIYYGDEVGLQGWKDPFNRRCFPWGNEDEDLLEYTRELGILRKSSSVFVDGELEFLLTGNELLVFSRFHRNSGESVIMFDNFTPEMTKKAVEMVAGRYETESSGGITFDTLRDYAECGVDFISVGALTHSVKGLDMSFKAC